MSGEGRAMSGELATAPDSRLSVLFVDDERAILRGLERALRNLPYRVLLADGAAAALAILAREPVDVLVADVDMPEMGGLELVEIARRDHPAMVRMLLSAQSSFEMVVKAINDGAISKYLTKPWDPDLLCDTLAEVSRHLGETRALAEALGGGEAQARALARYEAAYPGISQVLRGHDGVVEVDPEWLSASRDCLPSLRGLLS